MQPMRRIRRTETVRCPEGAALFRGVLRPVDASTRGRCRLGAQSVDSSAPARFSRRYTCPPCSARSGAVMDSMEKIVSLCKRRGFIFPSSEIYGGLNGAWDYGPLGVELKRNLKQAWWDDMVAHHDETAAPPGAPQGVRHGRPRQRAADEPEGLGSERPRRRLQRPDGRRPRDSRALSRGSARGLRARVHRRRRQGRALRRDAVRGAGRGRQVAARRALRAAPQTHRGAAEEQARQRGAARCGTGRAAGRSACAPRCSRRAPRHPAR